MVKIPKFISLTILLIAVICFCISGTVFGQPQAGNKAQALYRDRMEEDFLKEVSAVLEREHLYKSGLTMTKTEENGEREYKVLIHNKHINKMTKEEQKALQKELEKIIFPDQVSKVAHNFINT